MKNPLIADQVATNPAKADLSDRERHIVNFALKVAGDSKNVGDAELDALRANGFTDDEIWDIGAITALFGPAIWVVGAVSVAALVATWWLVGRSRGRFGAAGLTSLSMGEV